MTINKK